ncbi:periplasmic binding protein-like II [Neocallimastix californiae]|uniref:Periplasmic binding protein-like II n=1 Tax=Neocallimastix californiae TaxID=1754190 RepID=A0A1Y2F5P7_9FUNG|nr:periplasmic binding protein-like II [Neocallimastix californiae]|eukprot:ORY79240.1 periplasmic binding protein-like II [Neocallimastix californiae]
MILFSKQNSTYELDEYDSTIDYLLKQRSKKFDIYCFDPIYTNKYTLHMVDLTDKISNEHMELYSHGDAKKLCYSNNMWVGLPLFQKYSILYSNKNLLKKYDRRVPKTWEELLDTGKYILEKERANNNTEIIAYNGFFSDLNEFATLYEVVYSYRNTPDTKFPGFGSKEAIEGVKMVKHVKEEISSDDIFRADEAFNTITLLNGNGLFIRFWDTNIPLSQTYYITPMPGKKEGINASIIGGLNVGISKYSSVEKREAALKVIEYFTSEKVQKEIVIKQVGLYTGISKLYDDEEVCQVISCSMVKEAQSIHRAMEHINNIDQYSNRVNKIFNHFMFGKVTAEEVMKEIDDITRIYHISLDTNQSKIIFIIFILLTSLMLIIFTYIPLHKEIKKFYSFFTTDLWIMYCLGYIIIILSEFLQYGKLSKTICLLRYSSILIGISLEMIPIIYVLLISFPENNKYSIYLINHKYTFLGCLLGFEIILNILIFLNPFTIMTKIFQNTIDNKNFSYCVMKSFFGNMMIFIDVLLKVIMLPVILLLIFIEWNAEEIVEDIRTITINIYSNSICYVMLIVLEYLPINVLYVNFSLHSMFIMFSCLSNYVFIHSFKIMMSRNPEKFYYPNRTTINPSNNSIKPENNNSTTTSNNLNSKNIITKILDYHSTPYSTITSTVVTNPS